MDSRIVHFITALRASGVRVSLAESQDAFHAIDQLGLEDREVFRLSLKATLVKEARDGPEFDKLFPLFFGSMQPPMMNGTGEMSARRAADAAKTRCARCCVNCRPN